MNCPHCQRAQTVRNGTRTLQDQSLQQRYLCHTCRKRFNARTKTPMAGLRTPSTVVSAAINVRTEG
jgi:transposase-like protein